MHTEQVEALHIAHLCFQISKIFLKCFLAYEVTFSFIKLILSNLLRKLIHILFGVSECSFLDINLLRIINVSFSIFRLERMNTNWRCAFKAWFRRRIRGVDWIGIRATWLLLVNWMFCLNYVIWFAAWILLLNWLLCFHLIIWFAAWFNSCIALLLGFHIFEKFLYMFWNRFFFFFNCCFTFELWVKLSVRRRLFIHSLLTVDWLKRLFLVRTK